MRALAIVAFAVAPVTASAGVVCRNGSVVPAVLRKMAASLPAAGPLPMNVGSKIPAGIRTAAIPKVLAQILPQYPGYRALRTRRSIVIVKPRSRRIVYLLPLNLASPLDCPDS